MGKQANEYGCDALLTRREERFHSGGVGLVLGSGLASSRAAGRAVARNRVVRGGLLAGLLVLCTAGGFASAKVWDGRFSSVLQLELARDAVADVEVRSDMRQTALGQLSRFATQAVQGLIDARSDAELADAASLYLRHLEKLMPPLGTLAAARAAAADPGLGAQERRAALTEVRRFALSALLQLRQAAADPVLGPDAQQHLQVIGEVHYAGASAPPLDPGSKRSPR